MRKNYCENCYRKQECVKLCNKVESTVSGKNGRKKKRIELIYEHELDGIEQAQWNNVIYGAFDGE